MQYSPKLKKAAEEIKQILQKYDIAANVILHTPGHSEYLLHITPTYSCAWFENDMVRFRARKEDYNGNVMIRNQKIADTLNMLRLLSDTAIKNALALLNVADQFDKKIGADHTDEGFTSHTTQNN
jgi:hypothetical protein